MTKEISVADLIPLREDPGLALLDVRETAEYNLAHVPGFVSLPRRLIETRLPELVPWPGTRTIICDDDGRRAALAAQTLAKMGYRDVAVLTGGINRWVTDGQPTEWGLNVPSKDFGEKVLLEESVPEVDPDDLDAWLRSGDKIVLVDSRTPEEHARACIPGSRSMPGAELGFRIWELIEDPATTVVVHCAGRTRSIIGAGTLRRMGIERVFALKNGTMGWQLAGLELETGSPRLDLPRPAPASVARAEAAARRIATEAGVRYLDVENLKGETARSGQENVYLLDVRPREEFEAGHIPGFRWVPGGQAVQAADSYVGVRGGRIVFACDGCVRSSMTAAWFRDMGFANVYAVDGGTTAWRTAGLELESGLRSPLPFGYDEARARIHSLTPAEVQLLTTSDPAPEVIFVGTSDEFSAGHPPGARWLPRSWLELRISEIAPRLETKLIVTSADPVDSYLAAAALAELGYADPVVIEGGIQAWRQSALPVETGLTGISQPPDDVLPARRSYAEMLNYLRWEEELGHKYRREPARD